LKTTLTALEQPVYREYPPAEEGAMKKKIVAVAVLSVLLTTTAHAQAPRLTCKQVASCEEAVESWCGGYSRADADKDGIPCENVCRSRQQVEEIQKDIGC